MAFQLIPLEGDADCPDWLAPELGADAPLFPVRKLFEEFVPAVLEAPPDWLNAFTSCANRLLGCCDDTALAAAFVPEFALVLGFVPVFVLALAFVAALALPLSDVAETCSLSPT